MFNSVNMACINFKSLITVIKHKQKVKIVKIA
jgi:hypothetical protein